MGTQHTRQRCALQPRSSELSDNQRTRNTLFIQPEKVTEELSAYLEEAGVTIHAYEDTESFVTKIPDGSIMLDMGRTNYAVYSALPLPAGYLTSAHR